MKIISLAIGGACASYIAIHLGFLVCLAMVGLVFSWALWHDAFQHNDEA